MDAATVGAVFSGLVGLIGAVGAILAVYWKRPRMPVAEELLEQLDEMRDDLLAVSRWAHRAVAQAAAAGIDLEEPPGVLRSAGRRHGERRAEPGGVGWRSSVRVQTGEQPAIVPDKPDQSEGPATWPERRRPRLPGPPPSGRHASAPVPPLPGKRAGPDDTARIRH